MARAGGLPIPHPILCLPPATGDLPESGGLVVASSAAPYRKSIEHAGHSYQQQLIRTYAFGDPLHFPHPADPAQHTEKNKSDTTLRAHSHDAAKSLASKIAVGSDDLYELLELGHKRWHATADDIKKSFRRISLVYHPDKISHHGDDARQNAEAHFKAVMKAYDILSDKKKRAAYDSIDDVDDSIPAEKDAASSPQRFFEKFGACFALNSRWSISDRVPQLGDDNTPLEEVHRFYDFWYSFKSWRDFSFDTEYDPDQAECREEKRWMERQNAKNVKTKKLEENARIRRLVDLAYKHDPRLVREKQAIKARKDAEKEKRRQKMEEAARVAKEKEHQEQMEAEQKAVEEKEKKAAAKKQKDAQRQVVRKARQKLRAIGRELEIVTTERGLVSVESMCAEGTAESIEAVATALAAIPQEEEDLLQLAYELLDKARSQPQIPVSYSPEVLTEAHQNDEAKENSSGSDETKSQPTNDKSAAPPNGRQPYHLTNGKREIPVSIDTVWTQEELSLLSKAVVKFPGGTRDRWNRLAEFVGTKTADEILRKVNENRPSKIKAGTMKQTTKSTESQPDAFARFQEKKKGKPVVPQDRPTSTSNASTSTSVPIQPPNKLQFTPKQQILFEEALKKYPKGRDDRWDKIAAAVGRTAEHCQQRFNELIAYYAAKRSAK